MPPRRPLLPRGPAPASGRWLSPASPRRWWKSAALALSIALLLAALHSPATGGRVEEKPGTLPTTPELERLRTDAKEAMRGLSTGETRFTLEMKKAHVFVKVLRNGEVIGRFKAETYSTSVRAEITTYNIGRALGCGELFQPAIPIELRGQGLATFRHLIETATLPEIREVERAALLASLKDQTVVLHGAFKPVTPAGAVKYRGAERPDDPPNGLLELNDPIVKFLRHDSPQPGPDPVPLSSIAMHLAPAPLARQLSDILLVDALAGEWDRFSGNNLHILPSAHPPHFMAIDNGGADPLNDQGYLDRFCQWVTRFDPPVIAQLAALDGFLTGSGSFRGFTSEQALAAALGFDTPQEWQGFKKRVHRVNAHAHTVRSGGLFE